ncbi:uncharacterized protein LOC120669409 [Panicum virgatum]|uniref:uncharacterized protein LOC120669409 n=1 Tax=Panicum virgatum TaxID=38727 RepID=UPI0019D69D9F|nr:uncharacterized protein LOC120669409 [Panicum virgatum]
MDEDHTKYNARTKNALFDAISAKIFALVHSKKTAHEVWEELETIHVGSKKLCEEKYQVLKEKLNKFKMLPSELVEQIYARLNVLVENINALEISPLSNSDIILKILHSLHKPKYNIVISLLYEKNLSTLQVSDVVGKIWSHEMLLLGEIDSPQGKKDLALKAKSEHKSKKKNKSKASSPSSNDNEASEKSSDVDGDIELALLMRKTTKMMSRLNKKGYNYDPKKNKFRTRRNQDNSNKMCYNCGKYGHLPYDCPEPIKPNKNQEDEGNQHKYSRKSHEKKDKSKKRSFKRKENIKAFLGEWVTDGETSRDDSNDDESKKTIVEIAMHDDDEPPLPPPPMCFMARDNNKVSDDEDSSSDEKMAGDKKGKGKAVVEAKKKRSRDEREWDHALAAAVAADQPQLSVRIRGSEAEAERQGEPEDTP